MTKKKFAKVIKNASPTKNDEPIIQYLAVDSFKEAENIALHNLNLISELKGFLVNDIESITKCKPELYKVVYSKYHSSLYDD